MTAVGYEKLAANAVCSFRDVRRFQQLHDVVSHNHHIVTHQYLRGGLWGAVV